MTAVILACQAAALLLSAWVYVATAREVRPFRLPGETSARRPKPPNRSSLSERGAA